MTIDPLEVKSFSVTSDKIEIVDWCVNRILFEGGLCVFVSVCLYVFMCVYICVLSLHACKCVCVIMFAMGVSEEYEWEIVRVC